MSFCTVCGRPRSGPVRYCTACGAPFPEAVSSGDPAAGAAAGDPPLSVTDEEPDTVSADRSPGALGAHEQNGAGAAGQLPSGSAAEQDPFGDLFERPSGGSAGSPERFPMTADDHGSGSAGPPYLPPAPLPGSRTKTVVAVLAAVALLAAGGGVAFWVTHRHHVTLSSAPPAQATRNGTSQPAGASSPGSQTPSVSPGTGSEQAELAQVAAEIQQSVSARRTVIRATKDVGGCTMTPSTGISLMNQAISQRQAVIDRVSSLPVNAIPGGHAMLTDLTQVLQHSITADRDFIGWMQDPQVTATCPASTSTDASFRAGIRASKLAVTAKKEFLALWNPAARQFGQPTFRAGEI